MTDIYALSDITIIKTIGAKIKEARIEQDITQKELSKMAGVSMFSISSIENGNNTSILTLVQILRALNRFDFLNLFFKEKEISPVAYARAMKAEIVYQRAGRTKKHKNTYDEEDYEW